MVLAMASCTSTKQLTISTIEPSPVDFSYQIKKIGIVNSSKMSLLKGYNTRLEQLIYMEEKWLSEKGTEAALTGLFDELVEDERFDTVQILEKKGHSVDFGTSPSVDTWKRIAAICEENDVDAIFSLSTHHTETQFSLKKTKIEERGMLRRKAKMSGQEITLETLIENGWRIYDPKQRVLVDEFTSHDQVVATAKGVSSVDALQAIDNRRETLLEQSMGSGNSYAQRIRPSKLEVKRNYYVLGTKNFELACDKIQNGSYDEAIQLWEKEIANPKPRLSSRACYNLAVLSEFNGNVNEAMGWATKSYQLFKQDVTLDYITTLERRQAEIDVLKLQMAHISFHD